MALICAASSREAATSSGSLRSDSASARSRARRCARSASRIAVRTTSERDMPLRVNALRACSTTGSVRNVIVFIRQNVTRSVEGHRCSRPLRSVVGPNEPAGVGGRCWPPGAAARLPHAARRVGDGGCTPIEKGEAPTSCSREGFGRHTSFTSYDVGLSVWSSTVNPGCEWVPVSRVAVHYSPGPEDSPEMRSRPSKWTCEWCSPRQRSIATGPGRAVRGWVS